MFHFSNSSDIIVSIVVDIQVIYL